MNDNAILISDASFKKDRTAIIAVKDSFTNQRYQRIISQKIQNSLRAEELALKFSIEIAIQKEYRHVIFIYDCLSINTEKFKKRYSRHFETMQFLWLKRKYISRIDEITKVPQKKEIIEIGDMSDFERDEKVMEILSSYAETEDEINILKKFKNKEYFKKKENRIVLLNLMYFLLSKDSKKNLKRILRENLKHTSIHKVFMIKSRKEYLGILKQLDIKEEFLKHLIEFKAIYK